uniref:Zinc finger protein 516-like n=1 Tax=Camelus bactrianus TaxID=9837 RepID=A0A9W3G6W8_CAMBA
LGVLRFDPPGAKPHRCCFSEEVASTVLTNGAQSLTLGNNPSGKDAGEPRAGIAASVSALENSSRGASTRPEQPRFSRDLQMPAFHPRQEAPGPRHAAGFSSSSHQTFPERADPQLSSESQANPAKEEKLSDLHNKEPAGGGRRAPAPDLIPLDLSERSTRDDPSRKELASSLQAALAVHPCPYCNHKTYYPEVLWMHKRIWHRVSCNSMAPQWIQPNGYKSIRNNLVFLSRSGRTGPPPALGGKECQPLPISRFTRTQVSGGAPGPKGSPSPLGATTKAASLIVAAGKSSRRGGSDRREAVRAAVLLCARCCGQARLWPLPNLRSPPVTEGAVARLNQEGTGGQRSKPSLLPGVPSVPCPGCAQVKGADARLPACGPALALPWGRAWAWPCFLVPSTPPLAGCQAPSGPASAHLRSSWCGYVTEHDLIRCDPCSLEVLSVGDVRGPGGTAHHCPADRLTMFSSPPPPPAPAPPPGTLRTQAHQGDFVCVECGKSFHQPSHLRAHMRAHTVLFESNGLRGADIHATSADTPKQGRDHSNADTIQTVPLRKGS